VVFIQNEKLKERVTGLGAVTYEEPLNAIALPTFPSGYVTVPVVEVGDIAPYVVAVLDSNGQSEIVCASSIRVTPLFVAEDDHVNGTELSSSA
jgi:hypothetical protein